MGATVSTLRAVMIIASLTGYHYCTSYYFWYFFSATIILEVLWDRTKELSMMK
jgi:hypothetical protein